MKDGDPQSESFGFSSTSSRIIHLNYFLNISLCTLGTGYGIGHIGLDFFIWDIIDLFSRYQVFHQTTPQFFPKLK